MKKCFLKYGYFGDGGRKQISRFRAYLYKWFTNITVYIEENGKENWWGKT